MSSFDWDLYRNRNCRAVLSKHRRPISNFWQNTFLHLVNQRNDAIESADDCRRKFVARHLFLQRARSNRLTRNSLHYEKGPFSLWCDDFRPGNVLLAQALKIVGVVDREFT